MTRTKRQRTPWERVFSFLAWTCAVGAFTMTPLIGAATYGRPHLSASALNLFIAAVFVTLAITPRVARRVMGAFERWWAAGELAESGIDDRWDEAKARREVWEAGMPWVEADGRVTWGSEPVNLRDRNIHLGLHAVRMEAQPEVTGTVAFHDDGPPRRLAPRPTDPADIEMIRRYAASDLADDLAIGLPCGRVYSVGTLREMVARELGDPGPV